MGFFNFIESFFFISLAITFVLIMMIIYHFKERINVIEKKNETTIEILNNLAKELTGLRGFVLQMNSQSPPAAASPSSIFHMISQRNSGFFPHSPNITIDLEDEDEENIPIEHLNIGEELSNSIIEENIDSENGEQDDGDDEDQDDEDQDDDDQDDDDQDEDDEISAVSEESIDEAQEPEVQIEKIVVLDEPPTPVSVNLDIVEPAVVESSVSTTTTTIEDYNKLTTSQLKNIVLNKKIHTGNVNKLKRQELLKMLQETA
jgi:hypothetical protein